MHCRQAAIRPSSEADKAAIAEVHAIAFGRDSEARLAVDLIDSPHETMSLVADCDGKIVGHVLLTAIEAPVRAVALAPLAVLPQFREMQIGTALVREGLAAAREAGFEAVFVLGDSFYYQRFGFERGLAQAFDVPWQGSHFMALELAEGALAGLGGELRYPPQFTGSDY